MGRTMRTLAVLGVAAAAMSGLAGCGTDTIEWEPVANGETSTFDGAMYLDLFSPAELQNLPVDFDKPFNDNPRCTAGFGGSFTVVAKASSADLVLVRYESAPADTQQKNLDLMGGGTSAEPTVEGSFCKDGTEYPVQPYRLDR